MLAKIEQEKKKVGSLQRYKNNPNMITSSKKSSWLIHPDHRISAWYKHHHIPKRYIIPILKPYAECPLIARLFWNKEIIAAHSLEQSTSEHRLERRREQRREGDGGD